MRAIIVSFAVIIAAFNANAQTQFGVQGGANLGRLFAKAGSVEANSKIKVGAVIGAIAAVDLGGKIRFRPELNFIQKGGKNNSANTASGFNYTYKTDLKLSYIQLVPNFVIDLKTGDNKFFIGLGPDLSFGIGGKSKDENSTSGPAINITNTSETTVKFDGKKNANDNKLHLKGFDVGVNTVLGFQLANGGFISLSSCTGLLNISPEDNFSLKSNTLNLKIGFLFGGSKASRKK